MVSLHVCLTSHISNMLYNNYDTGLPDMKRDDVVEQERKLRNEGIPNSTAQFV